MALDHAREDLAQLIARWVVGIVAELFDAVGERGVGDHGGDRLHPAVDASGADRFTNTVGRHLLDKRRQAVAVVLVECLDRGRQLFVGGGFERPIEQAECLHPVLHLVHDGRRYRCGVPEAPDDPLPTVSAEKYVSLTTFTSSTQLVSTRCAARSARSTG